MITLQCLKFQFGISKSPQGLSGWRFEAARLNCQRPLESTGQTTGFDLSGSDDTLEEKSPVFPSVAKVGVCLSQRLFLHVLLSYPYNPLRKAHEECFTPQQP